VPDLETVMPPGCGHWTPIEQPADLAELVIGWLRRRFAR
jgi:pimeloyl-ACP methyl ester carboxylesterase